MLSQIASQPMPGWAPADFAATIRVAVLVLALPPVVFAGLAIAVERRFGPRWLAPLWLATLSLLLGYVALRLGMDPATSGRMAPVGGVRGFVVAGAMMYGVPFALIAGAASWLGAHRARPRAVWVQTLGVVGAIMLGIPLALALGIATETLWAG